MKKTTLQRLTALVLALCFLVGGVLTASAATAGGSSILEPGYLDTIKDQLNAISYEEYVSTVLNSLDRAETDLAPIMGYDYDVEKTGSTNVVVNKVDGVPYSLTTPATGSVTWTFNVPTAAKYSILIEYFPDEAKSTAIERILKINDAIPFSEARFITLPKVWKNDYVAAKVTSEELSLDALYDAAVAAGFSAESLVKNSTDGCLEIQMPEYWTQGTAKFVEEHTVRFFVTDIDNNELRPATVQKPEWCRTELRDVNGFYAESFEFAFQAGENTLTLDAVNEPMTVRAIYLIKHEDLISYEDYKASNEGAISGKDWFSIQSEYIGTSSTNTVYPIEDRTDAATQPADTTRTVLNTIGGEKWQTAGQWVRYTFKVNTSGLYNLAARYRQNVLDGMYVCRALYIYSEDGKLNEGDRGYYDGIPFYEASEVRFNYSANWQSTLFNNGDVDANGNPIYYEFYFEEGVEYTIQMEVTVGSMGDIVRRVQAALNAINADYLQILKLTGADPDEYRDYGFSRIMPDVLVDMIIQSREFTAISQELVKIAGEKSSNVATLDRVAWLLDRMGSNEDEIAQYLEELKTYIGTLGTWLGDAKTQPLQLDYITVQPLGNEAPLAEAGFFAAFLHEIKGFFMSFFRNYDRMGATSEEAAGNNIVDVWIATGRDQAQVLRNLINNDFTPNSPDGTTVNLQLVAGGTLLPSVLAGMGPDVYIGVGDDTVINYAIRGALLPVENQPGFADFALEYKVDENFNTIYDADGKPVKNPNSQFNEAAMLVLGIEDAEGKFHYYGLPETQGFSMMFIRTDVLANLDIEIPRTWDDILAAVPVLQANNMEIGMHTDYKIFLYQMGGELFADNGMRINLDSNVGLEAFDTMCSYFTMYSFPYSYNFANRFRTGEMPIGFAGYVGTYNHLTVFATEIKGLWEFLPMPGIIQKDANGNDLTDADGNPVINNVAVSSVSAICMMNGCNNEKGAWEFMLWHSGAKFQIDYANEMVAIIGPSAKHSTANLNALREMPWTSAEYEMIQLQFNNLASIPNYPGSYIIGRYTNFAFLAAYNNNANPITELQSYITTINKEITRKRAEFGLETLELGQTLASKRLDQVKEAFEEDTRRMSDDKLAAVAAAVKLMNEGITKENEQILANARDAFAAVNAADFADTITALNNAITVLAKYD